MTKVKYKRTLRIAGQGLRARCEGNICVGGQAVDQDVPRAVGAHLAAQERHGSERTQDCGRLSDQGATQG